MRADYEREIAPRTEAALAKILRELFPAGAPAPRALDLGAGTGAVGRALRAHFGAAVAVVGVDRVPGAGVLVADVTSPDALARVLGPARRFPLIVAAHVLNELFLDGPADGHDADAGDDDDAGDGDDARSARLTALVRGWCDELLAPDGTLILVEPALRETSRSLLAVRDRLLAMDLRVVAPCFWTGPCPALSRERDWCHDAAPPIAPGAIPPRAPGRKSAPRVDFSYLALRRAEHPRAGAEVAGAAPHGRPASSDLFRVVSDRLIEKGRLRVFGCGPSGRHPIVRLDRHASASNHAFEDLERGDVVRVGPTAVAQDGLRVEAETLVALTRAPASE